ncbi:hypothetical protein HU200_022970 [Digitaria exilis]|uniref:No apical meristem-associated C-terminal domain-containing protein n=1 Tax=Digitaria exilis TaxID=1010633 RepID=A0A835C4N2_9POAL|nr:hypothetical protein HU200_022970 [Digitaria exilis]
MDRQPKRTSAPAPHEIPSTGAPGAQHVPPVGIPSMFGPGAWCSSRPPQSMAPSTTPYWGLQHPAMAGLSPQGPWWTHANIGASTNLAPTTENLDDSDPQAWGPNSHPPGGFINFLNSTQNLAQAVGNGSSSQPINIGDDCARTEKRLLWTKEEDLRLVSAWLNNSNDPIQANYKKNDQYWNGVAAVYNSSTPNNPARLPKQIKDRFGRIKKRVAWFCASWKEANVLWASGESDVNLMDRALKIYEEEHKKDGLFIFKHCWDVLRKEPKWDAYLERLHDTDPDKRKLTDDDVDLEDELHKFVDAQKTASKGRKEMLETQKRVSSENLEAKRLAHLAAKEKKEAVMLETRSFAGQSTFQGIKRGEHD